MPTSIRLSSIIHTGPTLKIGGQGSGLQPGFDVSRAESKVAADLQRSQLGRVAVDEGGRDLDEAADVSDSQQAIAGWDVFLGAGSSPTVALGRAPGDGVLRMALVPDAQGRASVGLQIEG